MPQGDKSKYTDKQKRQAEHIEKSYEDSGVSEKEAAARAWATVNRQDHGGKMPGGSGRGTTPDTHPNGNAKKAATTKKAVTTKKAATTKKAGATKKAAAKKAGTKKAPAKKTAAKRKAA